MSRPINRIWLVSLFLSASFTVVLPKAICQPTDVCKEAGAAGDNAKLPEFEVATIKPFGASGGQAGILNFPGGRVDAGHMNVRYLLMFTCGLQSFQVVGGPSWVDRDFFNIIAKPPALSSSVRLNPPTPRDPLSDEQRKMLLSLLMDRFHLKFHVETRVGLIYLLKRGNGKLKLEPPKDPTSFAWVGGIEGGMIYLPSGIAGTNTTMALVADRLSRYLDHPVIDQTGIGGSFDFKFQSEGYDPNADFTHDDVISSILTSVREIGLKLAPAKGPIETIVIDHVEEPTPN